MTAPEIVPVRCLRDNYAWLLHHGGRTALFDAPEAAPVAAALAERGWRLDQIVLTHHHDDHIQAVAALRGPDTTVIGAAADAHRLPPLDEAVAPGDTVSVAGLDATAIDVSGHTVGHLAFHLPAAGAVFTGDSLMALGCGRVFEGDPAMMWDSLMRLDALPGETLVCSGHDYCAANAAFALSVDAENAALKRRAADTAAGRRPCAPATLDDERATNPFLRAGALAADLGEPDAASAFARLRRMKDDFRG